MEQDIWHVYAKRKSWLKTWNWRWYKNLTLFLFFLTFELLFHQFRNSLPKSRRCIVRRMNCRNHFKFFVRNKCMFLRQFPFEQCEPRNFGECMKWLACCFVSLWVCRDTITGTQCNTLIKIVSKLNETFGCSSICRSN